MLLNFLQLRYFASLNDKSVTFDWGYFLYIYKILASLSLKHCHSNGFLLNKCLIFSFSYFLISIRGKTERAESA